MVDRPVQVAGTGSTKTSPPIGDVQGCVSGENSLRQWLYVWYKQTPREWGGAHLNRYKEEEMSPREFEKAA